MRAAIAALSAIASLDQGLGVDDRSPSLEQRLAGIKLNGTPAGRRSVNRTTEKHVASLEHRVALLGPSLPGDQFAWIAWTADDELDCLEQIGRRLAYEDIALTVDDQLRWLEIEAGATRRMLAGEAPTMSLDR